MACNCVVAVREGNTVLGIDACDYFNNPQSHPTPYMLQYSATKEFGAVIYRSRAGNLFAVSNLLFESAWCSYTAGYRTGDTHHPDSLCHGLLPLVVMQEDCLVARL